LPGLTQVLGLDRDQFRITVQARRLYLATLCGLQVACFEVANRVTELALRLRPEFS
jgi:hypothetical protein